MLCFQTLLTCNRRKLALARLRVSSRASPEPYLGTAPTRGWLGARRLPLDRSGAAGFRYHQALAPQMLRRGRWKKPSHTSPRQLPTSLSSPRSVDSPMTCGSRRANEPAIVVDKSTPLTPAVGT